jgi:hypothetical protein
MMSIQPIDVVHKHAFWEEGCRTLAANVCAVLKEAGEPVTQRNIVAFVVSLPSDRWEMQMPEWQKGYCSRCLEKMFNKEGENRSALMDYFITYFPRREYHAQQMLIEAFRGILGGIVFEGGK